MEGNIKTDVTEIGNECLKWSDSMYVR